MKIKSLIDVLGHCCIAEGRIYEATVCRDESAYLRHNDGTGIWLEKGQYEIVVENKET